LDNIVYRMGFAASRKAARQLVRHRHVQVNGHLVDIPSYQVEAHDEVRVRDSSRDLALVRAALELAARGAPVSWLAVDADHAVGKVTELPTRDAIPVAAQEQLIVELYSK
jgi:small subunit ribosomal protein S4